MNFDLTPYGAYIWPAYGISLLLLGGFTAWTLAKWRAAKSKLAALEKK
jgi:heme exporter protein CcmD